MKAGLASDIDWTTTIIAAFSFLFHFGAVGSIYSDWMDPIVDGQLRTYRVSRVLGVESEMDIRPRQPGEHWIGELQLHGSTAASAG